MMSKTMTLAAAVAVLASLAAALSFWPRPPSGPTREDRILAAAERIAANPDCAAVGPATRRALQEMDQPRADRYMLPEWLENIGAADLSPASVDPALRAQVVEGRGLGAPALKIRATLDEACRQRARLRAFAEAQAAAVGAARSLTAAKSPSICLALVVVGYADACQRDSAARRLVAEDPPPLSLERALEVAARTTPWLTEEDLALVSTAMTRFSMLNAALTGRSLEHAERNLRMALDPEASSRLRTPIFDLKADFTATDEELDLLDGVLAMSAALGRVLGE